MPSLADIPTEFLRPDRKLSFLNWVSAVPSDGTIKRTLVNLWSHETGVKVSFALRTRVNMGAKITDDL